MAYGGKVLSSYDTQVLRNFPNRWKSWVLRTLFLIHAQVFYLAGGAGHTWLIQYAPVGLWGEGMGVYLAAFTDPLLKLKLQYFGHLIQKTDSLEKTMMLGKIDGRRRRG